jgi:RNA polymerase sigma factor (sigma-70 family)
VAYAADTDAMEPVVLRPRSGRPRLTAVDSESELLAGVRNGDDAAFEALYDAYHRRLLAFCQHMLGSREEAEDALQHTFLAAYRSLSAGYEVVDLKPWLYTIARNRCLSVIRARREAVELDDAVPATEGLATEVDRRADLHMLVRDVQRLPPDQRAALVLFEVGDHSHQEIAAVLGVKREKVKALVFQAREALMGWRTARDTPCAHVREQLATLRGRALGRATIRRHVELCSGCADYEAAVRNQRAALAIALPVAPAAAGLRAAVLGSAAGGSGLGAAVGAGGASSAAGGLVGLGLNGVAAKVLLVAAVAGGAGVARHATVDRADGRPAATAAPRPQLAPPVRAGRPTTGAPATAQPAAAARHAAATARAATKAESRHVTGRGGANGRAVATGKATAPGQLKAPGTPAQGKALGQTKDRVPKPARVKVNQGQGSAAPKPSKTKAVSSRPSKPPPAVNPPQPAGPPQAAKPPKPPQAAATAAPSPPGQSAALPPGQAKQQAETPKQP